MPDFTKNKLMKITLKKTKQMIITILALVMGSILLLWLALLFFSPGKPEPFLDNKGKKLDGSISEKIFITIGGVQQGMFIKSINQENPVLLYLHGGIPDYFLNQKYPGGLENHFTTVWWEQRGSGLSYNVNIPSETMNLDQLVSDTKEITNYLRARFGQEKIYLMGRSGGSFIGIHTAAGFPELYHAYIGVGQMSDQFNSEKMAYEYLLKQYRDEGNMKMVEKLEASPITDSIPFAYLKLRDRAMHRLGIGTTHDMKSVLTGLFIPSLTCPGYTLTEKFNLWQSKAKSGVHPLWDEMISTDLTKKVNKLNIPVYFFHGINDYTVSYPLAKKYLETLHAPVKGFYTFENSAHSPIYEEPDKTKLILLSDVITGKNTHADKSK